MENPAKSNWGYPHFKRHLQFVNQLAAEAAPHRHDPGTEAIVGSRFQTAYEARGSTFGTRDTRFLESTHRKTISSLKSGRSMTHKIHGAGRNMLT